MLKQLQQGWKLQDAAKVAGAGDVISKPGFDASGWHAAVVPGTVMTSLVADGTYPDPLFGLNNVQIPDTLCRTAWWYRTSVDPPARDDSRHAWLKFEGINYRAEVWLNGLPVGVVHGAFARGKFDVTSLMKPGTPAALAVLVHPQPHPGESHQKSIALGTGLNGGLSAVDGPTFLCTIGWDWIPTIRDRATGIWQSVSVVTTGPVVIEDPAVRTALPMPRTDSAEITLQTTLLNASATAQSGALVGTIGDGVRFRRKVQLKPHESLPLKLTPKDVAELRIKQPRLWWPNGYGEPHLYALKLEFVGDDGQTSDVRETKFGIRQIDYTWAGSDNLTLVVNGVPVVAKGGNWGLDEALKRISPARIDAQVRLHQLANYTIIRNWVGQSTSEAFYDACDRYGLLVWDEFFQPNPGDGPDPIDTRLYLDNVREKLIRYGNHPCIALWCARNEGDPPADISRGIQKLIDEHDSVRLYQPSSTSGRGVNSGGPYCWRPPQAYYTYDEAFKTEIGSVSIPTLEAVKAMLPEQSWGTIDESWAERDLCGGAQRGDIFPAEIAQRYGQFSSLADFVRKGQLATYEAYRAMYEGRFAKLFRPVTGVITWMSNPAQPSFVWQLYSHDLEPNAALFATRKACEPVHVQMNQNDWHLVVVNNRPAAVPQLKVTARVFDLDGTLRQTIERSVDAAASAATDLGELKFDAGLSAVHLIKLELRDSGGALLSDNVYWRGVVEDDLTALDSLADAAVKVAATRRDADGTCKLFVTLTNPTNITAVMAHLQMRNARTGNRVLPVFYSDNYVCLLPGERKEISIEAAADALAGDEPLLAIDGWNVTLDSSSDGVGVTVVANTAAYARSLKPDGRPATDIATGFRFGQTLKPPVVKKP